MATNIALVGPGAVGTTVAALLSRAGHSVVVCGRTPRESIELRPDGADPIVVPGPVHTDPGDVSGPVDVVLLAVKATQNDQAAGWLARLCDVHTIVVVLQNGVEQVEQVQPHCPRSPVIPGIVWYSAETQPDGWVRLRGEAALVLPSGPSAETVAELLRGAGCRVDCDPDIITAGWRKLLTNALAGFMALSRRRSGMFRRDDVAALSRRYLAECLAVARAEGARLPDGIADELTDLFRNAPEDMGTSILTDAENHRPMEWDVRNGVIIRKARAHGLATPISDVVVPLLAAASDGPG
ncbi:oxidoreductase [Mycobacterium intracellulare]|uniref:2-dehydropantoate 2-reductase n=1 Tax=Mycobacterium intracellulare TaxID=1767 RepID=A0AAE4RHJ5_MYCIT|nr:oxidoreductase [Mycobacterium intracellulare]MCA2321350.1 oxidoreductase [Mycobacterium intracellulare]MCA2343306.1 oxidoreductase [Mycobacterium intracellulare]MDV6979426.1 oxidoreductase [Mycobacterium intracellulare]MDV6984859.1 oxidoreductase [Mycobacterium intracellulare]MDV7014987.1 oxidoreductase [Mycobacterium intracellulare]